jgi:hypothetical protein
MSGMMHKIKDKLTPGHKEEKHSTTGTHTHTTATGATTGPEGCITCVPAEQRYMVVSSADTSPYQHVAHVMRPCARRYLMLYPSDWLAAAKGPAPGGACNLHAPKMLAT